MPATRARKPWPCASKESAPGAGALVSLTWTLASTLRASPYAAGRRYTQLTPRRWSTSEYLSSTVRVPRASIGYTRSLKLFPWVTSSRPGSTPRRWISSNISRPRALSTGTAGRITPSISSAKAVICWPSASGNCTLPSSWRRLGLKKTILTVVSAMPPLMAALIDICRSSMGSEPGSLSIRRGGIGRWAKAEAALAQNSNRVAVRINIVISSAPDSPASVMKRMRC